MQLISEFIIGLEQSIRVALRLVNDNGRGICFVTDNSGLLVGVVTDGDIRRALLRGTLLDEPVSTAMNSNFISLNVSTSDRVIRETFTSTLKLIPLCDDLGRVVDVADVHRSRRIPILEPQLTGNELEYVTECIKSNWISSQGEYVTRFEKMFESMHPGMHALCVSNGTVALHLALVSMGIKAGDEVLVPDITFAATINAVLYCNATPVICEIDPASWCIDVGEAAKLVTSKTKAILPVHLYGQVCHIENLKDFAKLNQLILIEDCAEALGSSWMGEVVGTFGDASIFSFFGNKTISTGEGGMILFKDIEIYKKAKILRDHGMAPSRRYWHESIGFNYRLTNLQAAIGVAQMERLPNILRKKREIALMYSTGLENVATIRKFPLNQDNVIHSNWLYTILLDEKVDRDALITRLMNRGIDTRPVFYPLHEMPPYKAFKRSEILHNSKCISKHGISLPSSTTLEKEEIDYVIRVLSDELN